MMGTLGEAGIMGGVLVLALGLVRVIESLVAKKRSSLNSSAVGVIAKTSEESLGVLREIKQEVHDNGLLQRVGLEAQQKDLASLQKGLDAVHGRLDKMKG